MIEWAMIGPVNLRKEIIQKTCKAEARFLQYFYSALVIFALCYHRISKHFQ